MYLRVCADACADTDAGCRVHIAALRGLQTDRISLHPGAGNVMSVPRHAAGSVGFESDDLHQAFAISEPISNFARILRRERNRGELLELVPS
jgi:hypothetical protein